MHLISIVLLLLPLSITAMNPDDGALRGLGRRARQGFRFGGAADEPDEPRQQGRRRWQQQRGQGPPPAMSATRLTRDAFCNNQCRPACKYLFDSSSSSESREDCPPTTCPPIVRTRSTAQPQRAQARAPPPYDSTTSAMTIEEAMRNFKDLTNDQHLLGRPLLDDDAVMFSPPNGATRKSGNTTSCVGDCAACTQNVLQRLQTAMQMSGDNKSKQEIEMLIRKTEEATNVKREGRRGNCPGLGQQPVFSPTMARVETAEEMTRIVSGGGASPPEDDQPLLGTTIRMGCPYIRGAKLGDGSGFRGLCSLCWAWRILPDGYSPKIINEIMCNDEDGSCLDNFGKCRKRYMPMTVYQNVEGVEEPTKLTVNTLVSCECQVKKESKYFDVVTEGTK